MRKRMVKNCLVFTVAAACLVLSSVLWAQEKFEAKLVTERLQTELGPDEGEATKLEISIEGYTSTEEVSRLKEVFYKEGYESFMSAFRGMNKGVIRPVGGYGIKVVIHAAHSIATDKGRKILLFTSSHSWDTVLPMIKDFRASYNLIELDIDREGKGKGRIYEQVSIKLSDEGTVEMDSHKSTPLVFWGVRAMKK